MQAADMGKARSTCEAKSATQRCTAIGRFTGRGLAEASDSPVAKLTRAGRSLLLYPSGMVRSLAARSRC